MSCSKYRMNQSYYYIYLIHYNQTEFKGNKNLKIYICTLLDPGELQDVSLICKYMNSLLDSSLIKHFSLEKSET